MSRICLALTAIFVLISGLLIAQAVQSEDIHYYLYEYVNENGDSVAIVIEVNANNPTSPGSDFNEVTVEILHGKGLRTPSESEKLASVIDKGYDPQTDYGWCSWITADYYWTDYKRVECGSKTTRPFYAPGFLGITAITRRWLHPNGPMQEVSRYIYETYGYYTSLVYRTIYHRQITYTWYQNGIHWWDPGRQNVRYSSCSRVH